MSTETMSTKQRIESPFREFGSADTNRFLSILRRYLRDSASERARKRKILAEYLKFSPNAKELAHQLVLFCIAEKVVDRLDVAIDILTTLQDEIIQQIVFEFLHNDIQQWTRLQPDKKWEPAHDYWYVLLRAVGRCKKNQERSCQILSACQDDRSREIGEAVVEALGDLGTNTAVSLLQNIKVTHADAFVRKLASEVIEECKTDE